VGKHTKQLKIINSKVGRGHLTFFEKNAKLKNINPSKGTTWRDIGQCSNIVTISNFGKQKQTCETKGTSSELQDS